MNGNNLRMLGDMLESYNKRLESGETTQGQFQRFIQSLANNFPNEREQIQEMLRKYPTLVQAISGNMPAPKKNLQPRRLPCCGGPR